MNKNENESMISCICEKFKASILFHNPPFGCESGWTFTALSFSEEIVVMNL